MSQKTSPDIKEIVRKLGGPSLIAQTITDHLRPLSHAAVCQWVQVPAEYCPLLEAWSHTHGAPVEPVTCEGMRPDIYIRLPVVATKA